LNDPVHPVAFEQGLSEDEGMGWGLTDALLQHCTADRLPVDTGGDDSIAPPSLVPEPKLFPNPETKTVPQMGAEGACDRHGTVLNLIGGNEEDRHVGTLGVKRHPLPVIRQPQTA
jgi:hypothetical protein